jgi:hypothetical protein
MDLNTGVPSSTSSRIWTVPSGAGTSDQRRHLVDITDAGLEDHGPSGGGAGTGAAP